MVNIWDLTMMRDMAFEIWSDMIADQSYKPAVQCGQQPLTAAEQGQRTAQVYQVDDQTLTTTADQN